MSTATGVGVVTAAFLAAGTGAAWPAGRDFLSTLEDRYAQVRSVHLRAQVNVPGRSSEEALSGPGTFEYWAGGARYRIACDTPQALQSLGALGDTEVAFDGKLFQHAMPEMSMLALSATRPELLPTALPNPFFLPLRFLTDTVYQLRLDELPGSPIWRARVREAGRFYEVDGRWPTGEDVHHLLSVTEAGEVGRIETRSESGTLLSTLEFGEYEIVSGAGWAFPQRLVIHDYSAVEDKPLHIEYDVQTIEVNTAIDSTVFTIDPSTVDRVWDSDARRYLKRPGP